MRPNKTLSHCAIGIHPPQGTYIYIYIYLYKPYILDLNKEENVVKDDDYHTISEHDYHSVATSVDAAVITITTTATFVRPMDGWLCHPDHHNHKY